MHSQSRNTIGQCLPYNLSHTAVSLVLYAVDKGLCGQNVLQSVVIDSAKYLLKINSLDISNVAMSLYDIMTVCITTPSER